MLPSVLANQLQKGIADYIDTTFPMVNEPFRGSVRKMVDADTSVYHKPYVSVKLPFRVSPSIPDYFESIHMDFRPYVHQTQAFKRLKGNDGRSTLIATGTGSGKTECFLYPILEYCYRHRGEDGIKALIIYPMNALASDQARRIAELIWNSKELKNNVNVGMYVGGEKKSKNDDGLNRLMREHMVITDHDTLRNNPPDILLTNYKMLDYLLVRPKDALLWRDNKEDSLKYVAVDELHTFDGAQGTDLACLLRRLKTRLGIPLGQLCCIGTSATMGGEQTAENMRKYAESIFGEPFDKNSVITEDRLSPDEYLEGEEITDFSVPTREQVRELEQIVTSDDADALLRKAASVWLSWGDTDVSSQDGRVQLSSALKHHQIFQAILRKTKGAYYQTEKLIEELSGTYSVFGELGDAAPIAMDVLYALISHARIQEGGQIRPFLTVQTQLWIRELRRLLSKVDGKNIRYEIARNLNQEQAGHYLPVVNCRDCGQTGWVSWLDEKQFATIKNISDFYAKFFEGRDGIALMYPYEKGMEMPDQMLPGHLCPYCLKVYLSREEQVSCESCGTDMIPVMIPKETKKGSRAQSRYQCPFCGSDRGIALMGVRTATESAAMISQMFASRFNDDKKTLAFSDNVQDAAHRAGFFNARTWRFNLRTAMQRYVQEGGEGRSLAAYTEGFRDYWNDASRMSKENYVSTFIAPNMVWMQAYEDMCRTRSLSDDYYGNKLIDDINRRLSYEIMLEYGLGARIGRTLEKSCCSALYFAPEDITSLKDRVKERVINEYGVMQDSSDVDMERIVVGILDMLRRQGAFHDKVFRDYVEQGFSSWHLSADRVRWMPGLQSGRNTPRLFVISSAPAGKGSKSYDTPHAHKYTDIVARNNKQVMTDDTVFDEVVRITIEESVKLSLVEQFSVSSDLPVYGLNKDKVYVSAKIQPIRCNHCGTTHAVAAENAEYWKGAPCIRKYCSGSWESVEDAELDYYGKLFSTGDIRRINAREHTGLLERAARERLETDFKRREEDGRCDWDPNVLSCTPTLEMGIDIGDLSTVILCNMPPAQAQFLQRAGRAGRRDGNALTLVCASAKPHDLYFYAEPSEMMGGEVQPPKVFLDASAVLERQFVAFCMDSWVRKEARDTDVPRKVGDVLSKLKKHPTDAFPFNFLNYVQANTVNRLNAFKLMFPELQDSSKAELDDFATGGGKDETPMYVHVLKAFQDLKQQRDGIKESKKQLEKMIKVLEDKPQDVAYEEELKDLRAERDALQNVIKEIEDKEVYGFLSDEGILPNYAFPESGIVLKSVLYRKSDMDTEPQRKGQSKKMVYEYHRSASAAISEFAPGNTFYAEGRKMKVDQVDVSTAKPVRWRLCPNCSFAKENVTGEDEASCPRCGAVEWSDSGQVRDLLKVQMVYSNMDYTKGLIGDDSDDRTTVYYRRRMLVDVDEAKDIQVAYEIENDTFPFGYEFVKKATIREINFGENDTIGETVTVSGETEKCKGFRVCKYCGKIISDKAKGYDSKHHTRFCKTQNMSPFEQEKSITECLFLYRQLETEALRILIPAMAMNEIATESFVAAFMLGMKEHFGNVDHLKATISGVPVAGMDDRKQYLVIYDEVPGGTGYLKQLVAGTDTDVANNPMVQILEKALAVMKNCSCKDDAAKDGCYHCLFAYRLSNIIGNISRREAVRIVESILKHKDSLKEISRISEIQTNKLMESELERRFVLAFEQCSNSKRKIEMSSDIVRGKLGYRLKIGDVAWEVEPQVDLDTTDGVVQKCRPDFVLHPITHKQKKPVAVFTDGFTYHKDEVYDDTLKREAVRRSGQYVVWSLSYKDVQSIFQDQGVYFTNPFAVEYMPSGAKMYQPILENAGIKDLLPVEMRPFELLLRYLEEPEAKSEFAVRARAYAMSLLNAQLMQNQQEYGEWQHIVQEAQDKTGFSDTRFAFGETIYGSFAPTKNLPLLRTYAGITRQALEADKNTPAEVLSVLDDIQEHRTDRFEEEWNGFWHFWNLMQFLPRFMAVSTSGLRDDAYHVLHMNPVYTQGTAATVPATQTGSAWEKILEDLRYSEPYVTEVAKGLAEKGVPVPDEIGLELENQQGAVIGMIEMAWKAGKIGFLTDDQLADREQMEKDGWKFFTKDDEVDQGFWEV